MRTTILSKKQSINFQNNIARCRQFGTRSRNLARFELTAFVLPNSTHIRIVADRAFAYAQSRQLNAKRLAVTTNDSTALDIARALAPGRHRCTGGRLRSRVQLDDDPVEFEIGFGKWDCRAVSRFGAVEGLPCAPLPFVVTCTMIRSLRLALASAAQT